MKLYTAIIAATAITLAGLGTAWAGGEAMKGAPTPGVPMEPQTICPVMHRPITKDISVVYQGKRVYFCCPACKIDFEKNPGQYMVEMQKEGIRLEEASAPAMAK